MVNFDDFMHSRKAEDHLDHFEQVIDRLHSVRLKMSSRKCHFYRTEVSYLGHVVNHKSLRGYPLLLDRTNSWRGHLVRTLYRMLCQKRTYAPYRGSTTAHYHTRESLHRCGDVLLHYRLVARALIQEVICRYGAPLILHSDQGRNFES